MERRVRGEGEEARRRGEEEARRKRRSGAWEEAQVMRRVGRWLMLIRLHIERACEVRCHGGTWWGLRDLPFIRDFLASVSFVILTTNNRVQIGFYMV